MPKRQRSSLDEIVNDDSSHVSDSEASYSIDPLTSDADEFILPPSSSNGFSAGKRKKRKIRSNRAHDEEESEYDTDNMEHSENSSNDADGDHEDNTILPNGELAGQIIHCAGYTWTGDAPDDQFPVFRQRPGAQFGLTDLSKVDRENAESPSAYWEMFLGDGIVDKIVRYTNKHARHVLKDKWVDTNLIEIRGFIGLCYMLGVEGKARLSRYDKFSSIPGLGSFSAPLTFSSTRYRQILRFLCFDDVVERRKKPINDRHPLDPVSEVFSDFIENCRNVHIAGKSITVGESMANFKGVCKFGTYLGSKACRYGLKIWCVNDSKNSYLSDAAIYSGKTAAEEDSTGENSSQKVVLNLTQNLRNAGRTVVCGSFFTSIPLADELYKQRTYLLGKIRLDSVGVPKKVCNSETGDDETTSRFLFADHRTLLRYQKKSNKPEYFLSTVHHKPMGVLGKPEMVKDYDESINAVEVFDDAIKKYSEMIEEAKLEKKKIDDEEADQVSLERLEEQKLMSKFPNMKKAPPVGSQFLQKRLQQRKFFDSGDYNMAKAKGLKLPVGGAAAQAGGNENVQPPATVVAAEEKSENHQEPEPKMATITTTVTPPKISQSSLSVSTAGGREINAPCGSPTGMEIPTPETVPLRKTSIVTTAASKLSPQPLLHHSPTGNNPLPGSLD